MPRLPLRVSNLASSFTCTEKIQIEWQRTIKCFDLFSRNLIDPSSQYKNSGHAPCILTWSMWCGCTSQGCLRIPKEVKPNVVHKNNFDWSKMNFIRVVMAAWILGLWNNRYSKTQNSSSFEGQKRVKNYFIIILLGLFILFFFSFFFRGISNHHFISFTIALCVGVILDNGHF